MITSVVVTYRVLPEAVAEHVRLIEAVFEQLRSEKPTGLLDYQERCRATACRSSTCRPPIRRMGRTRFRN